MSRANLTMEDVREGKDCETCDHGDRPAECPKCQKRKSYWDDKRAGRVCSVCDHSKGIDGWHNSCPMVNGKMSGTQYPQGGRCWRPRGAILVWEDRDET